MLIAAPVGLFAAIYLVRDAGPNVRGWVKPILEILAGIPTGRLMVSSPCFVVRASNPLSRHMDQHGH